MRQRNIFSLIFVFCIGLLFFWKSMLYIDPDLGWSLMLGKIVVEQGFPKTDPFSYTMPDFPVVLHSWFSEVVFYRLYEVFGIAGIAAVTSAAAAALVTIIFGTSWQWWTCVPAVLVSAHLLPYIGTRAQTFSWLLFALLLRILLEQESVIKKTKLSRGFRHKFILPVLFFAWAQLHGGFFIGLAVLTLFALTRASFNEKRVWLLVLIASVCATVIHPYGIGLWREVLFTFFSLTTHTSVNEWAPLFNRFDGRLVIVLLLPILFVSRFYVRFSAFFKATFITALLLSLSSGKLLPYWLVVAGYAMANGFAYLLTDASRHTGGRRRFALFAWCVGIAVMANSIVLTVATAKTYSGLSEAAYYPKNAAEYIKNNPPQGNIFAPFGWGGYLVWQLPQHKVFINGLMPHWGSILDDYSQIIKLQSPFSKVAESYNISMVLVQKNRTVFDTFTQHLKQNGWVVVYEDGIAALLIRP